MSLLVTLDWESAYGVSPTGRKVTLKGTYGMSTEEYVRDHEFRPHGLGVKVDNNPARYYYGQELLDVIRLIPWHEAIVLAHHTHFDGAVLAWRCGIKPKFWLDTISMSRAIYNQHPASLEYLAKFLGVGEKGKELADFKNKWTLTDEEQAVMAGYCINDVELTYKIFKKLNENFPLAALRSIDDTIRMFTEPQFAVNTDILVPAYRTELHKKRDLIKDLGVTKKQLNSNKQFAGLLEAKGVEVPMKISPTTHKLTFAFAKTDEKFIQLEQHPDPAIGNLVKARLGVKTSIVETRLKRFYRIGKRGMLPAYLKSNSAHTKRWGGGDKTNLQNMSNRGPGRILRNSLVAPKGKKVVVCDLSQIEARFLVWWAGQLDSVEMFRRGEDPYNTMASALYGRPVDRKRVEWVDGEETLPDKAPGAVGKATILGCGYGLGWFNFQGQLRVGFLGMEGVVYGDEYVEQLNVSVETFKISRSYDKKHATLEDQAMSALPNGMDPETHIKHCAVVWTIVNRYRELNPMVKALWKQLNGHIMDMILGREVQVGPFRTGKDCIHLPSGLTMYYPELEKNKHGDFAYVKEYFPSGKKAWTKLYGGKLVENLVQSACQILIADSITKTNETDFFAALTVHDEIVCVPDEDRAPECLGFLNETMTTAPAWCHDLPLAAEGDIGDCYGDAK